MTLTAYLAPEDFEHELADELALAGIGTTARHERLFLSEDPPIAARWAANVWHDAQWLPVSSIGDAARQLRGLQRSWATYSPRHTGRSRLITEKLPHVSAKPLALGDLAPTPPLGSWMLVEPTMLIAAQRCSDPFPNGAPRIDEQRVGPPSRAYLKLWEAFARARRWPTAGEYCLDLGASPGGWTWLAAQTGATVVAIDKAPLAEHIDAMPNVRWQQGSAFALDPHARPPVDWLLSDIICYPGRLLDLVQRWIEAGAARNIVCTIKFQGPTDHGIVADFAAIAGSDVRHLHHNKHELTFTMLDIV